MSVMASLTSSRSPSMISILASFILLGLGCIAGFGVFHTIFHHRCSDVMDEAERNHNETLATLHQKLVSAVDDHKRCIEDDSRLQEVYDLRGRLESQADIKAALSRQQDVAAKVDELQRRLQQTTDELATATEQAQSVGKQRTELERRLWEQQDISAGIIRKQSEEISAIEGDLVSLQQSHEGVQNHIRQRQSVMCRQFFGKGPYYVQFVVGIPYEDRIEEDYFVVEISSRKHLPHSIFTFISLVESTFYDGASLESAEGGILHVGWSPWDGLPTLEQKLNALGFSGGSALSFLEESQAFPCGPLSLGFVDRGPLLHLFLSEIENDGNTQRSCFGKVVRGMELLPTIQSSIYDHGRPVQILRVEHLRLNEEESAPSSNGEL